MTSDKCRLITNNESRIVELMDPETCWPSGVQEFAPGHQTKSSRSRLKSCSKEALQTVWPMFELQEHWSRSRYPRKLSIVGMNCMLITCQEISLSTSRRRTFWAGMYFSMNCCISSTDNLHSTKSSQEDYFII